MALPWSYSAISVSAHIVKTSETTDLTTFTRPTITCISAFPSALIAASLPRPAPLTNTSTDLKPWSFAAFIAVSATVLAEVSSAILPSNSSSLEVLAEVSAVIERLVKKF